MLRHRPVSWREPQDIVFTTPAAIDDRFPAEDGLRVRVSVPVCVRVRIAASRVALDTLAPQTRHHETAGVHISAANSREQTADAMEE